MQICSGIPVSCIYSFYGYSLLPLSIRQVPPTSLVLIILCYDYAKSLLSQASLPPWYDIPLFVLFFLVFTYNCLSAELILTQLYITLHIWPASLELKLSTYLIFQSKLIFLQLIASSSQLELIQITIVSGFSFWDLRWEVKLTIPNIVSFTLYK